MTRFARGSRGRGLPPSGHRQRGREAKTYRVSVLVRPPASWLEVWHGLDSVRLPRGKRLTLFLQEGSRSHGAFAYIRHRMRDLGLQFTEGNAMKPATRLLRAATVSVNQGLSSFSCNLHVCTDIIYSFADITRIEHDESLSFFFCCWQAWCLFVSSQF